MAHMTDLLEPVLVVGAGGAGSRLASDAMLKAGLDCLLVSNDGADLTSDHNTILVSNGGVINPSNHLIRSRTSMQAGEITDAISRYSSVILMANLAGKSGSAISPVISRICRGAGKKLVTFAIMPFGFEKDRLFTSAVSLKRLRADSDCTVVIDNDAVLENNPDLSKARCHELTNSALLCVVKALGSSGIPEGTSVVSAGRTSDDVEESLRDSLKMLYSGANPDDVGRSILYVLGGEGVPVGVHNVVTGLARGILGEENVDYTSADSAHSGVVMVSALRGKTRFDAYDPLGSIPDAVDWDELECSIDCQLDIPQIE